MAAGSAGSDTVAVTRGPVNALNLSDGSGRCGCDVLAVSVDQVLANRGEPLGIAVARRQTLARVNATSSLARSAGYWQLSRVRNDRRRFQSQERTSGPLPFLVGMRAARKGEVVRRSSVWGGGRRRRQPFAATAAGRRRRTRSTKPYPLCQVGGELLAAEKNSSARNGPTGTGQAPRPGDPWQDTHRCLELAHHGRPRPAKTISHGSQELDTRPERTAPSRQRWLPSAAWAGFRVTLAAGSASPASVGYHAR